MKQPDWQEEAHAARRLSDALHSLHRAAGAPSAGDIAGRLYEGGPSRTSVWNVFSRPSIPKRGLLEVVVHHLAEQSEGNAEAEVERFGLLWEAAYTEANAKINTAGATSEERPPPNASPAAIDLDPALTEAWIREAGKPVNGSSGKPTPRFSPEAGPVRYLQRALWGLYVDAGLPRVADAVRAMGLGINASESVKTGFQSPHRLGQDKLRRLIWFLAEQAGYDEPNTVAETFDLMRQLAIRQEQRKKSPQQQLVRASSYSPLS